MIDINYILSSTVPFYNGRSFFLEASLKMVIKGNLLGDLALVWVGTEFKGYQDKTAYLGWEVLWLTQLVLLILTNPQGVSDLLSDLQIKKPQLVLCIQPGFCLWPACFSQRHGWSVAPSIQPSVQHIVKLTCMWFYVCLWNEWSHIRVLWSQVADM